MPEMDTPENTPPVDLETRSPKDMEQAFILADRVLQKKYVSEIGTYPIRCEKNGNNLPLKTEDGEYIVNPDLQRMPVGENIGLYRFKRIVYDKSENIHDKLITVYSSICAHRDPAALVLLLHGCVDHVDVYIGTALKKLNSAGNVDSGAKNDLRKSLENLFKGNFPGSELVFVHGDKTRDTVNNCFNGITTIAAVSGIAALRNQNEAKNESFVQSMEKLIDTMRGKKYTALYLADAMRSKDIEPLCASYEDLYASLSPFKQSVHTRNANDTVTDTSGQVKSITDTTNESIARAVTTGTMKSTSHTFGGGVRINNLIPVPFLQALIPDGNFHYSRTGTNGENHSDTESTAKSTAKSLTSQNSVSTALAKSCGESLQITYENRAVRTLLERIDEQIKRLRSCEDFGLFNSCVYFMAPAYEDAVAAASAYKSLIRGENSSVESSAINVWTDEADVQLLSAYLKRFHHPEFGMKVHVPKTENAKAEKPLYLPVTPALLVSGRELAYQFSLPKSSVSGLPVLESTAFGRQVQRLGEQKDDARKIELGKIYHMRKTEDMPVELDVDGLAAHVFVTGSTGSGKSNTIYHVIDKLKAKGVKYLVIEPAKGEYKHIFGGPDTQVYGTNSRKTELLRLNPFAFPEDIGVMEHIDRLIEIFNACWPMYAAMPAILKDAVEKAYEHIGWNLRNSTCEPRVFPTFRDLLETLPKVISESSYSADTRSDYTGALLTRVRSLTNGINGQIFCSGGALSDEALFDQNVIIDLSRVGSSETRSLMMGILVMKIREYRLATGQMNAPLSHVTILEEAHNLLRRTSMVQSQEGANLQGKAVEMLTHSIAEMRTYGEGFFIVDQAPELLDEAAVRNTNTKIVLRLPYQKDRDFVGTSMALNEAQLTELAKLPLGVAAVYQNDWEEAVLCHTEKYDNSNNSWSYSPSQQDTVLEKYFAFLFGISNQYELTDEEADTLRNWMKGLQENARTLDILKVALRGIQPKPQDRSIIAYNLFHGREIALILADAEDTANGIERADSSIQADTGFSPELVEEIRLHILEVIFTINEKGILRQRYHEFVPEGGRFL